MKTRYIFTILWIMAFGSQLILQQSCKKKEVQHEYLYLTVNLPRSVLQNESYYSLSYQERSIEMDFNQQIDSSTIKGNISFSDKNGVLDSMVNTIYSGRKIIIAFRPGFQLHDGWKYLITITTGLRSTSGLNFLSTTTVEVRTTARHLVLDNDTATRNSIVCISDIQ